MYARKASLIQAIRLYTRRKKPFKCDACNKCFCQSSNLIVYQNFLCAKDFVTKAFLSIAICINTREHDGEQRAPPPPHLHPLFPKQIKLKL